MKIIVLKESNSESRVAVSPETVKKLSEMGHSVFIQKDAGVKSNFSIPKV